MASELKSCPFCGSEARLWPSHTKADKNGSYEIVGCSNIDCFIEPTTDEYLPYEEAVKRWNTRPTPVAPVSPDATGKCGDLVTIKVLPDQTELVTRSQAEELLAAERAEKERWHKKAMDAGVIVHSDGTTSHPMRKERDDLKADNAALTARVKELEQIVKYETAVAQAEIDGRKQLEAKLAAAETAAFEHGYVLACCNIVNLHDEPTIAHDTLSELGVTRAAVKEMNLSEYDLKALRKIERDRSRSPYAKANRKARAVLGGKPLTKCGAFYRRRVHES